MVKHKSKKEKWEKKLPTVQTCYSFQKTSFLTLPINFSESDELFWIFFLEYEAKLLSGEGESRTSIGSDEEEGTCGVVSDVMGRCSRMTGMQDEGKCVV